MKSTYSNFKSASVNTIIGKLTYCTIHASYIYIYIYIYTYTHVYVYARMCVCVYIYIFWGPLKSAVNESNTHTIQELKDNIRHAVAAIRITVLHRVYLNMIRRTQPCIDAGGNHFQHLLRWYILSAFGYCINFCI